MNGHPVTLHVYDDLRRSRLTVFFRPALCYPHLFWLTLWSFAVAGVLFPSWLVALIIGRPANSFQRFFAAFLRYSTTVLAFLLLIANPFPGFLGEAGRYPIELEVPTTPEKQHRLSIFFRVLLAYPAIVIAIIGLYAAIYPVTALAWLVTLITGRMPRGFRDLGANSLRYLGQIYAYLFLVTGAYPCSSPYVGISLGVPVATEPKVEA